MEIHERIKKREAGIKNIIWGIENGRNRTEKILPHTFIGGISESGILVSTGGTSSALSFFSVVE